MIKNKEESVNCSYIVSQFQPRSHDWNINSMKLFFKCFHGNRLDDVSFVATRFYEFKPSTRLAAMFHKLTIEMGRFNHNLYANSFFTRTSLPVSFFTARIDLKFDLQFDFLLLVSLLNAFRNLYSFTLRNALRLSGFTAFLGMI